MFTRAIVRPPAANFAEGLTTAGLGAPDYERALEQHAAYCLALEHCGLTLTKLDPEADFPDSTFVEDVAVLTSRIAVLTRPGAISRVREVERMRPVLSQFFPSLFEIQAPGTLDGGDVCQVEDHFFIGLSERTNEAGAMQLAEILVAAEYTTSLVDWCVRSMPVFSGSLLHLKSGVAALGDNRLAVTAELATRQEFARFDLICVGRDEEYAANCIRVNDYILIAAGHPEFETELQRLGYRTVALEMSEFQKMDGGLSCLSLRF